jgi:hypothetical protein
METNLANAGDDPFWEGGDIWYGTTADQEWYDSEPTTRNGSLLITLDLTMTTEPGWLTLTQVHIPPSRLSVPHPSLHCIAH